MKPTACRFQDRELRFLVVGSTLATFQKVLFDKWLSRILEWFDSSCISDQVVVVENWYGVELAIWAHAA